MSGNNSLNKSSFYSTPRKATSRSVVTSNKAGKIKLLVITAFDKGSNYSIWSDPFVLFTKVNQNYEEDGRLNFPPTRLESVFSPLRRQIRCVRRVAIKSGFVLFVELCLHCEIKKKK